MRKVEINKNGNRKKSNRGPRSPQEPRELNLPVINKLRKLRRKPSPQEGGGDPGGGDVQFPWPGHEQRPDKNVTRTGGQFLSACHRYIPPTRPNHPIPRFLSPPPGDQTFESEDGDYVSLRQIPSSFQSRVGVTASPDTKSNLSQRDSKLQQVVRRSSDIPESRRPTDSLLQGTPGFKASLATRKAQSESVIPEAKQSESRPLPLPYYSFTTNKSSDVAGASRRKLSLPDFLATPTTQARSPQSPPWSRFDVLPEPKLSKGSLPSASFDHAAQTPPVLVPRKSLFPKQTKRKPLIADIASSQEPEPEPIRPTPKPRNQTLPSKSSGSGNQVEELTATMSKEECVGYDYDISEPNQNPIGSVCIEIDPNVVFAKYFTKEKEFQTAESIPQHTFDPCQGFTSPIHRKSLRARYREIQPRYTEEPLFWFKSKWAKRCGYEESVSWPPDAKVHPTPDFLLNNALRVVREPKRVPIPKYQDSSTGKVSNWCTSGLARNYIYKPDFGKVPAYLHSEKKRRREICAEEFGSIMNMCYPNQMYKNYFSKS